MIIKQSLSKLLGEHVALQVYVWLLCNAGPDGISSGVSRARVAALLGITQRQFRTATARLLSLGIVTKRQANATSAPDYILTDWPRCDQDVTKGSSFISILNGKMPPRCDQDVTKSAKNPPFAANVGDSTGQDVTKGSSSIPADKSKMPPRCDQDPIYIKRLKEYIGSDFYLLSEAFVADSKKRMPSATRSLGERAILSGAEALDQLTRLDGYDLEVEIKPTLRWARKNPFWALNLLSLGSLRKKGPGGLMKYEQIRASMEQETQTTEHPGAKEMIPVSQGCSLEEWTEKTGGKNSLAF